MIENQTYCLKDMAEFLKQLFRFAANKLTRDTPDELQWSCGVSLEKSRATVQEEIAERQLEDERGPVDPGGGAGAGQVQDLDWSGEQEQVFWILPE